MRNPRSLAAGVLAAPMAALAALAGCAADGGRRPAAPQERPAEEVVLERAVERWEHLIAGRYEQAFAMLSPGARSLTTLERYAKAMAERPVKWTAVQPLAAECEGEPLVCTSEVRIAFKVKSHLPSVGWLDASSSVAERWIRSDGAWVHVPAEVEGR